MLSDSRLGIDASHYLQLLTDNPPSREPLLAATGGLPLALTQRIESDLRVLEKLRIKPVFVFPGLPPNKRWKQHLHGEHHDACRDRRDAWAKYEQGQEDAATKLFEGRSNLTQWDLWRMVLRIFRHRNVEFLIAPYVAWAQVSLASCRLPRLRLMNTSAVDIPPAPPQSLHSCHFWSNGYLAIPWCR